MEWPDITALRRRHAELDMRLQHPDAFADPRRGAELAREHQRLAGVIALEEEGRRLEREEAETRELTAGGDAEMRELAAAELPGLRERLEDVRLRLRRALVPPDPADGRNTILEIRAGTGGEEAALFAAELARAYQRYAEDRGWTVEHLSWSPAEAGGAKEAVFMVRGDAVFRTLKFESGVHRVQRVPVTEASGRIHTSTVTVAVLPEAEEVDIEIRPDELEITVSRASGPGGQGVNTTDSAVQILHRPTGTIVTCADERSQLKNKNKAMSILRARLLARKVEEEAAKAAAHRRGLIGTGDRSERIRTYNFPQSRLTDHRIGLTIHSLSEVMEGGFSDVFEALAEADLNSRIAALGT